MICNDTKYFIYCRKSTDSEDKQVQSIEAQERELAEHAEKNNLNVIGVFTESKTAHHPGRPVLGEVLGRIDKGEADGLIVWHANRISRNPVDSGAVIYMLDVGKLKQIETPSKSYMNTPQDKFMLQLEFGMSKKDSDDKGVVVKRGLRNKVKNGWRPSPAPIGYINIGEVGDKTIAIDPDRFDLIRKMWDMFLSGSYSVSRIRDIANNEWGLRSLTRRKLGGKPLSMSHMYNIFNEPFYYGYFFWNNYETEEKELYKGAHKTMITENEFTRGQVLLGKRGKIKPQTREFAFTGLISCGECGCSVTAEEKNQIICNECKHKFAYENKTECPKCQLDISEMFNPTILNYVYYHCTKKKAQKCTQKSIRLEKLEETIDTLLRDITIDQDYLDVALDYLQHKQKDAGSEEMVTRNSLQSAYETCQTRLKNLHKEYTSPQNSNHELYTPEEFQPLKAEIVKERNTLESKISQVKEKLDQSLEATERVFNFCAFARHHFNAGDLQEKRKILGTIGSNLVLKDKKLCIEKPHPYILIENELKEQRKLYAGLEPEKEGYTKRKEAVFQASLPDWLHG